MSKSIFYASLIAFFCNPVFAENQINSSLQPLSHDTKAIELAASADKMMRDQPINCNYHIPPTVSKIDHSIILKWAEKATIQSFDFDYSTLDAQLEALKACFTESGWQGFHEALQKSGNLSAIKTHQLMVSPSVTGPGQISDIKENQWKITLPLQVVYQNKKEKLTQPLIVTVIIGRKISGDLGIMQMIAIPHTATNPAAKTPPPR